MTKQENYFDAISYFDYKQNLILEDVNKLENICKDPSLNEIDANAISKLRNINERVRDNFIKYYTLQEDILFPELEKVLPSPTSTTSMRNEHREILNLIHSISQLLDKNPNSENTQKLNSTIISLADIIRRHIHKKTNIMDHEVSAFLSEKKLNEIYETILSKL